MLQITPSERSLMNSRKNVGSRMEASRSSSLISSLTEKRRNNAQYLTWNFKGLKFVKKTNMPNPVKSLGYITWYSSSSSRPVKSTGNSSKNNKKIKKLKRLYPSWLGRLKPYCISEKRWFP